MEKLKEVWNWSTIKNLHLGKTSIGIQDFMNIGQSLVKKHFIKITFLGTGETLRFEKISGIHYFT